MKWKTQLRRYFRFTLKKKKILLIFQIILFFITTLSLSSQNTSSDLNSNKEIYRNVFFELKVQLKRLDILTFSMKDQAERQPEDIGYYYQLLASERSEERQQAHKFFELLIDSETAFSRLWNILTRSESQRYRTLAATLIHNRVLKHLKEMSVQQKLHLKNLLMTSQGQLTNNLQPASAIRVMAQIVALIAVNLYPQSWPSFFEDLLTFGEQDIFSFKSFLEILEEIPRVFDQEIGMSRVQKMAVLSVFKQQPQHSKLIQLFLNSLQINIQEIKAKILIIVHEWARHSFPIINDSSFTSVLVQITLTEDDYIRQNILDILFLSLSKAAEGKRKTLESATGINFERSIFNQEELASVQTTLDFILQNGERMLHSIFKSKGIDDLQNFMNIIRTLMIQYGFIHESSAVSLLNLVKTVLGNEHEDLIFSFSTFEFLEIYLSKMYGLSDILLQNIQLHGVNIVDFSMEVLQLIIEKVKVRDNKIVEDDFSKLESDEVGGKVTFMTYRQESRRIIKLIFGFMTERDPTNGIQMFYDHVQNSCRPISSATQHGYSSNTELVIFILDTCYSKDQSVENDAYQTKKAFQIIFSIIYYKEQHQQQILPSVSKQLLVLISRFSQNLVQNNVLYIQCLRFCIESIQKNPSEEAILAFKGIMNQMPEEYIEKLVFPLITIFIERHSVDLTVHEQLAQQIFRVILTSSKLDVKLHFFNYWDEHLSRKSSILSNQHQSDYNIRMSCLIQAKILLSFFTAQPEDHLKDLTHFFSVTLEKGLKVGIQTINSVFEMQNETEFEMNINKCIVLYKKIMEQMTFLPWNSKCEEILFPLLELTLQLFDTEDYSLLLTFSQIVQLTSLTLKQFRDHQTLSFDALLKPFLPVFDKYIVRYYDVKCKGNLQKIDPDLIKIYYLFEESLIIYQPLFLKDQSNLIVDFAFRFLEVFQSSLQKVLFSFLKRSLQICYSSKKLEVIRKAFYLLPYLNECCHHQIVELILLILSDDTESDIKRKLVIFLSGQNYKFLPEEITLLILEHLPLYIKKMKSRYVREVLSLIIREKKEGTLEDIEDIQRMMISWSETLRN